MARFSLLAPIAYSGISDESPERNPQDSAQALCGLVRVRRKATTLVIGTLVSPGWKYLCGPLGFHFGSGAMGVAVFVAIPDRGMVGASFPTPWGRKEKALSRVPCRREKGEMQPKLLSDPLKGKICLIFV